MPTGGANLKDRSGVYNVTKNYTNMYKAFPDAYGAGGPPQGRPTPTGLFYHDLSCDGGHQVLDSSELTTAEVTRRNAFKNPVRAACENLVGFI